LNSVLKSAFPTIPFVRKPEFLPSALPLDPNWIAGFINGDGSFSLGLTKSSLYRLGYTCNPRFSVGQHARDRILLERIQSSFNCGSIYFNGKDNF
jgi:LAGLIDADG endonuclease